ncbi:hypothetical protein OIU79_020355, partial [Salix purpurea]
MQSCEGKGAERVGLGGPRSEDSFRKELTSKGGRQGKVETECQSEEGKRNALKREGKGIRLGESQRKEAKGKPRLGRRRKGVIGLSSQ